MTESPASGRRQVRAPGRPRPVGHRVKVTVEQEERLQGLAAARGITVARLLVESALAGSAESAGARAALAAELSVAVRAFGRVGVNVNQIARATNASGEIQEGTAAALRAVEVAAARARTVLADIGLPDSRRVAG